MAALEVIIYAGAIVVLFIFAVMLLSPGESMDGEGGAARRWILARARPSSRLVLLGEIVYVI